MIWYISIDSTERSDIIHALEKAGIETLYFSDIDEISNIKNGIPELAVIDVSCDGKTTAENIFDTIVCKDIPAVFALSSLSEYNALLSRHDTEIDYLVKPFGTMELISKIKSILRKNRKKLTTSTFHCKGVDIDFDIGSVRSYGEEIHLSNKEFTLLCLLAKNPDKVFTRKELYDSVWNDCFTCKLRTVDNHIRSIREKLGKGGSIIFTVRNEGFCLRTINKSDDLCEYTTEESY